MTAVRFIDALLIDMQGRLRCKRLPVSQRDKLLEGETRLPLSTLVQDIFGDDLDRLTGIGLADGDPDGLCVPALDSLAVQPWNPGIEQVIVSLHERRGGASPYDVRELLAGQIAALAQDGLVATVALELEFYLFDGATRTSGRPVVPERLSIAGAPNDLQLSDARVIDRIEALLDRIHAWADALDVPTETTLAEFGPGQFEVNLKHRSDPLRAADEAALLKRIVDRVAFEAGLVACFMAKPWTEHGGSGQHVHLSLATLDGDAVFDADAHECHDVHGERLAVPLAHALGGLLEALPDAQLLFAPHGNSYRRLQPESFAPSRADWGIDHRGVALRLPETCGPGARLEHRVPGSDACGHLVLAALLGGVRAGLAAGRPPSLPPLRPGETSDAPALAHDWLDAVERFHGSSAMRAILGERFVDVYGTVKRHEAHEFERRVGSVDWEIWLPRV